MAVNAVSAVLIFIVTGYFNMTGVSYLGWGVLAIKATVCGVFVVF